MKSVQILPQRTHAHGFSLLEMLLVLFLIGLMASAGLMLTEGVEDQTKYDETKRRMELMRRAIVGDPTRTVNGGPEISGFVADMGRLPGCVRELLELNDCADPPNPLTEWHIDPDSGLGSGWRGPYIQVLPEHDGELRFRDGYGNSDASDAENSGWIWQLYQADETLTDDADVAAIIRVQSFGLNGTQKYPIGDIDAVPANRPNPLIGKNDWQVQLPATVNVTFKNQNDEEDLPSPAQEIVLLIYEDDLSSPIAISETVTLDAGEILKTSIRTRNFTLSSPQMLAMGNRGYVIACDKWDYDANASTPDEYTAFLGSGCSDKKIASSDIRTFSAVPRQNLILNLDWIIS